MTQRVRLTAVLALPSSAVGGHDARSLSGCREDPRVGANLGESFIVERYRPR
jgi:hypothetical protein